MKTTTDFQLVNVSKLIPYVNNARTHSKEQITKLRSSLREFGFINPIIIDKDFNVIAGHGRLMAAKEEGIDEVPCVFVDYLTEAQKKAYILADNRMALDAGWDESLLAVEIEELKNLGFDTELTGFDEKEIADLFSDGTDSDAKDDDFDLTTALEKAAFVVLYGFMQNGKHKWYSDRKQTTIWNFDKPKRNANHPTSKPLDLLGYPIGNSTQENGVVIDTFGGSGSTLMACEQMNRICYMMELDEKYASVILRRYVEDTGDAEGVFVERDGKRYSYAELVKEVELLNDEA